MKTIQMTLDDELVHEVDEEVEKMGTSRSAFTREALRKMLDYYRERERVQRHIAGYRKQPSQPGEFDDWEDEQVWVD
jgi:metal-responsive CopG/Arc/MetJ family transcriptional regulator